jgi:hypothetical protein
MISNSKLTIQQHNKIAVYETIHCYLKTSGRPLATSDPTCGANRPALARGRFVAGDSYDPDG